MLTGIANRWISGVVLLSVVFTQAVPPGWAAEMVVNDQGIYTAVKSAEEEPAPPPQNQVEEEPAVPADSGEFLLGDNPLTPATPEDEDRDVAEQAKDEAADPVDLNEDGNVDQEDVILFGEKLKEEVPGDKAGEAGRAAAGWISFDGDLNDDGAVDEKDSDLAVKGYEAAFEALSYLPEETLENLDWDKNGAVDRADLEALLDVIREQSTARVLVMAAKKELARMFDLSPIDAFIESFHVDHANGTVTFKFKEGRMADTRIIDVLGDGKLPDEAVISVNQKGAGYPAVQSAQLRWYLDSQISYLRRYRYADISFRSTDGLIESIQWTDVQEGGTPCAPDAQYCLQVYVPGWVSFLYRDEYGYAFRYDPNAEDKGVYSQGISINISRGSFMIRKPVRYEEDPLLIDDGSLLIAAEAKIDLIRDIPAYPQELITLEKMSDQKYHITRHEDRARDAITVFGYVQNPVKCRKFGPCRERWAVSLATVVREDLNGEGLSKTEVRGNVAVIRAADGTEAKVKFRTIRELLDKIAEYEKFQREIARLRNVVSDDLVRNFGWDAADFGRLVKEGRIVISVDLKGLKISVLIHEKPAPSGTAGSAALVDPLTKPAVPERISYKLGQGLIPLMPCKVGPDGTADCPVFVPEHFFETAEFRAGKLMYSLNYLNYVDAGDEIIYLPKGDNRLRRVLVQEPYVCPKGEICLALESTLVKDIRYKYEDGYVGRISARIEYGSFDLDGVRVREVVLEATGGFKVKGDPFRRVIPTYRVTRVSDIGAEEKLLAVSTFEYSAHRIAFCPPGSLCLPVYHLERIVRTDGFPADGEVKVLSVIDGIGAGEASITVRGLNVRVSYESFEELLAKARALENLSEEQLSLLAWVNEPAFNFDFDRDGKLSTEDYSIYKQFDGSDGDVLPSFLTPDAKKRLDLNRDVALNSEDVIYFGRQLELLKRVNDPAFNLDFDGDGAWTDLDYTLFKQFDGSDGDILAAFLTGEAGKKLDLNQDGVVDANDVLLFGEWIQQSHRLVKAVDDRLAQMFGEGKLSFRPKDLPLTQEGFIHAYRMFAGDIVGPNGEVMVPNYVAHYTFDADGGILLSDNTVRDLMLDGRDADALAKQLDRAPGVVRLDLGMVLNQFWFWPHGAYRHLYRFQGEREGRISVYYKIEGGIMILRKCLKGEDCGEPEDPSVKKLTFVVTGVPAIEGSPKEEGVVYLQLGQTFDLVLSRSREVFGKPSDYRWLTPEEISRLETREEIARFVGALQNDPLDLDRDGRVTEKDTEIAKRGYDLVFRNYELLTEAQKKALDLNLDGAVGKEDLYRAVDNIVSVMRAIEEVKRLGEALAGRPSPLYVDFNGDGMVDKNDILHVLSVFEQALKLWRYVPQEAKRSLDYNGDGRVDEKDVELIVRDMEAALDEVLRQQARTAATGVLVRTFGYAEQELLDWEKQGLVTFRVHPETREIVVRFDRSLHGQIRYGGEVDPLGRYVTGGKGIVFTYDLEPAPGMILGRGLKPALGTLQVLIRKASVNYGPEPVVVEEIDGSRFEIGKILIEFVKKPHHRGSVIRMFGPETVCFRAPCPESPLVKEIVNQEFIPCDGDVCLHSMPSKSSFIKYVTRKEGVLERNVSYNLWEQREKAPFGAITTVRDYVRDAAGNLVIEAASSFIYGAHVMGAPCQVGPDGTAICPPPAFYLDRIVRATPQGETLSTIRRGNSKGDPVREGAPLEPRGEALIELPSGPRLTVKYGSLEELLELARAFEQRIAAVRDKLARFVKAFKADPFDLDGNRQVNDVDLALIKSGYSLAVEHAELLGGGDIEALDRDRNGAVDKNDAYRAMDAAVSVIRAIEEAKRLAEILKRKRSVWRITDFNRDGVVSRADRVYARSVFEQGLKRWRYLSRKERRVLDFNRDGVVDRSDLKFMAGNFETSVS